MSWFPFYSLKKGLSTQKWLLTFLKTPWHGVVEVWKYFGVVLINFHKKVLGMYILFCSSTRGSVHQQGVLFINIRGGLFINRECLVINRRSLLACKFFLKHVIILHLFINISLCLWTYFPLMTCIFKNGVFFTIFAEYNFGITPKLRICNKVALCLIIHQRKQPTYGKRSKHPI